MADFAYAMGTGKIAALFNKIHDVGTPTTKVTQTWLTQVGFSSSNDRRLLAVLKQVGFLDGANMPTDVWKRYRSATTADRKKVLAQAVREGYKDLYDMYPNAQVRSDNELESFFRGHVSAGSQVLTKTIQTFKALAAIAEFDGDAAAAPASAPAPSKKDIPATEVPAHLPTVTTGVGKGTDMSVVINIQLAVPETKDAKVYDAFFESLKKHLLS